MHHFHSIILNIDFDAGAPPAGPWLDHVSFPNVYKGGIPPWLMKVPRMKVGFGKDSKKAGVLADPANKDGAKFRKFLAKGNYRRFKKGDFVYIFAHVCTC